MVGKKVNKIPQISDWMVKNRRKVPRFSKKFKSMGKSPRGATPTVHLQTSQIFVAWLPLFAGWWWCLQQTGITVALRGKEDDEYEIYECDEYHD